MDGDEGTNKKLRKPYTITKSRDRWSEEEHERFLDGLLLFGREWKKIEDFVGSKTVIQIRSHAQKYFLKVQKNGLMAHVPPPRPKRIRGYLYPEKSSEDDSVPIQASIVFSSASSCLISPCTSWDDKSMLIDYTSSSEMISSSNYHPLVPGNAGVNGSSGIASVNGSAGITSVFNQNTGTGNLSRSWVGHDVLGQGTQQSLHPSILPSDKFSRKTIPNFADVYFLIGSIVDPECTFSLGAFLQKLNEMDPITAKTALILMKNLTANLSSPDFEPIRYWLVALESNNIQTDRENSDDVSFANQCAGFLPLPGMPTNVHLK